MSEFVKVLVSLLLIMYPLLLPELLEFEPPELLPELLELPEPFEPFALLPEPFELFALPELLAFWLFVFEVAELLEVLLVDELVFCVLFDVFAFVFSFVFEGCSLVTELKGVSRKKSIGGFAIAKTIRITRMTTSTPATQSAAIKPLDVLDFSFSAGAAVVCAGQPCMAC